MKLKVTPANLDKITAALEKSRGRATKHIARAHQIYHAATMAEIKLNSIGLPKSLRAGANAIFRSGGIVARSYKYSRIVSHVRLLRGKSDWFIVDASTVEVMPEVRENVWITITADQDAYVVAKFRDSYQVAAAARA